MLHLKLLLLDIKKHLFGSLVMILLIASAVALSIGVNLQERAFREGSARAAERFDLLIGAKGSEIQLVLSGVYLQAAPLPLLDTDILKDLQNHPQVAWAAPLAFGDFYQGMPIIGTSKVFIDGNGSKNLQGRNIERAFEAVVGVHSGLVIGQSFSPMHGDIGSEGAHSHDNITYTVVGILPEDHSIWDKAILVPIEAVWDIHADHDSHPLGTHTHTDGSIHYAPSFINALSDVHEHSELGISAIVVKPKGVADAYNLRSFYRRHEKTQAVFPTEVLVRMYGLLGDSKAVLNAFALAAQILVAVALLMVITLHLRRQAPQIAAWRIFGAPRHKILLFIWLSLLAMIAVALLLGIAFGYLAAAYFAESISARSGFALFIRFAEEDVYLIAILLLGAMVMALIPSLMLYRRSPLSDLQHPQ